jgi:histidinol dehydrogenase
MHRIDWSALDERGRKAALSRPQFASREEVTRSAVDVIQGVRREGDAALRAYTERFDAVSLRDFAVSPTERAEARAALKPAEIASLGRAIANVERFHRAQPPSDVVVETEPGVRCEILSRPITSVGLYVPAGSAPLPSTVIMLAVPARLAGCRERVLCTPPQSDGRASPAVLVAAALCGIEKIFKVGGAQAIAALGFGTESIPKVEKIFGPGNAWVTAAKQILASDPEGAACDLPAGPSEVLIIADESAGADFVAADLLAQAEHDAYAQAILVSDSRALIEGVAVELRIQREALSRASVLARSLEASRSILVPNLDTAFEVANAYAPEHLILHLRKARDALPRVENAGAIFLGRWSAEALGDYCSGANHVLPTYGHARALSGLSVRDFLKTISVQEVTPAGLRALGPAAITLASLEGLDAHAQAVRRRLAVLEATTGDASALQTEQSTVEGAS